jgi:hypothetical protein
MGRGMTRSAYLLGRRPVVQPGAGRDARGGESCVGGHGAAAGCQAIAVEHSPRWCSVLMCVVWYSGRGRGEATRRDHSLSLWRPDRRGRGA